MTNNLWLSAYGEPYDPRTAIEAWRTGQSADATEELWEKLYHQGSVNSASYAAVVEIVRLIQEQSPPNWNAYALVASIEEGRLTDGNPPIPPDLEQDYRTAWAALLPVALRDLSAVHDDLTVRGILAVIAHAKGQHTLATIAMCTEDERAEMLKA